MENQNYENAIKLITSREKFHIRLGLDRVSQALELLGNPQDRLNIIHVAGTNGKGSVCAILSAILSCAGFKTGLYTSPHIIEYTERIKINRKNISKSDFADLITEISLLAKVNGIYLTEFELLTCAAYKYFADKETDICVIETGLGGRLDATSAINKNILSIITSISLDHTDRLGDTVEKIAFEKAGIIKNGYPVLISSGNKGFDTIKTVADKKQSDILTPCYKVNLLYENSTNYALYNNKKYEFSLLGLWQKENLELVFEAVRYLKKIGYDISENAVEKALKTVCWSCRMQYSLTTKDYKKVMEILFKPQDEIYFYDFNYPSSVPVETLKELYPQANVITQKELEYLAAENKEALVIISGSFYMIGQILSAKGLFRNIAELDNIY